jgi:hypothetical protein
MSNLYRGPIDVSCQVSVPLAKWFQRIRFHNKRLTGACNRSPGSKLLSITTQLHSGGHLGGRARLPDTILKGDNLRIIQTKFG